MKYWGYIDNDKKPVANTHALLTYKFIGISFSDEGCFSDKLLLSGSGKRDHGRYKSRDIGQFDAYGYLSGDAAREYNDGRVQLGTFSNDNFKRKNDRLEKMGLDAFKQEVENKI